MTFTNLISEIQRLTSEDKENLKVLLEKYIIEERRADFYNNYKDSVQEINEGKQRFSNDIKDLKKFLD